MPKLTKKAVEAAAPREAPFFLWCSDLPGFGVRIFPSGKRVYYADYRNQDGRRKRMALGAHGKLTTEEARKLAVVTLGNVLKGSDPAEERATRRNSMTVAELCDDYLRAAGDGLIAGKGGLPKKASTISTDAGRIARHIKPLLGRKLVKDVVRADIQRFVNAVIIGKTATVEKSGNLRGKAVVEGGRGTANRTAGLLGGIFSYAVSIGIIDSNPVTGVKRPADGKRTRRLSPEEFRKLGDALAAADLEGERWQVVAGIRLLALTGFRLSEIAGLEWSEIDEAGGCLRLADSKEGASVRPVGRAVFDVLATIGRKDEAIYVFPAVRGADPVARRFGGLDGGVERIMKRAGLDGVTAHTLRHSFASVAADLGFVESTISAMVGHTSASVTGRYIHQLDAVLVVAADKVAREIDATIRGREDAKIVQLPQRGRPSRA